MTADRNQVFRAVLEKRGRVCFFRVTVTEGCRGRTGGLLSVIEKVGVGCFFGAGGCFFRVVVMVRCTGGLLNVIEKVGLVDFIGERSSAILSLFLPCYLFSISLSKIKIRRIKRNLKLYLISINYIYKMKKIIFYIYKKCWDIIANPTVTASYHFTEITFKTQNCAAYSPNLFYKTLTILLNT